MEEFRELFNKNTYNFVSQHSDYSEAIESGEELGLNPDEIPSVACNIILEVVSKFLPMYNIENIISTEFNEVYKLYKKHLRVKIEEFLSHMANMDDPSTFSVPVFTDDELRPLYFLHMKLLGDEIEHFHITIKTNGPYCVTHDEDSISWIINKHGIVHSNSSTGFDFKFDDDTVTIINDLINVTIPFYDFMTVKTSSIDEMQYDTWIQCKKINYIEL